MIVKSKLNQKMYGVILAAGKGDRIKPLSFDLPKPLLPVCNKPIMQYQLEDMIKLGIRDYVFVVGHLKEKIIEYFGNGSLWGVNIRYVEQKEKLGIAHALGQLEGHLDAPFMLFLGDIFIVSKNLYKIVEDFQKKKAAAVLAVKREKDIDSIKKNFTVVLHNRSKKVKRVIEKPRYLSTDLKGCGVYLFNQVVFDAIRCTPRTAMRDEYEITTAIQILIDDGCPVFIAEIIEWDMNVTVPKDLLLCNQGWLKHLGKKKVVSETAIIPEGSEIINSVIGRDVEVKKPIKIRNCVVMDGAKIKGKRDISDSLISPDSIVT